ncbi:MAG: hypothetical protein KDD89_01745 [Anaerolineales bacterium]|nr:hypothetical protein [Anaerolineales bacterium]
MTLTKLFPQSLWLILVAGLVACGGTAVTNNLPAEQAAELPTTSALAPAPTSETSDSVEPQVSAELPPASADGATTSELVVAEAEGLPVDTMPVEPMDVFSGTAFVLNATLPTEPTTAVQYEIPAQNLTLELATAVAAQFGFSGPLYQEQLPSGFMLSDEGAAFVPQMPFMAFQGDEQLTVAPGNVFYENTAVSDSYPSTIAPDQAQAAAEAFLNGRGLLNFAYEARPAYAGDIYFHETVDGVLIETPRIVAHVNNDGQVVRISYTAETGLVSSGETPLITAETAWQQLQSGVRANEIAYTLLPVDANNDQPLPPNLVPEQRWVRERPAGESAILYGYPSVMVNATDPNSAPRVQLLGYELVGTAEQLSELANVGGQNTAVQGTISADGQQLEITTWDLVSLQPLSLRGTFSQDGDRVIFTAADGQAYLLPNPPANIVAETAGQQVDLFAWDTVTNEQESELPRLEWETMQVLPQGEEGTAGVPEPALSSFMPLESFRTYEEATINSVRLVYFLAPQVSDLGETPQFDFPAQRLQPMWEFSGVVDGQDILRLYVPAANS